MKRLTSWLIRSVILLGSISTMAGEHVKSIVYPVSPDLSQTQAVEKALLLLQTEAIQESGVLIQQVMNTKKTEFLELSEEHIRQMASAVTLTRIINQTFDGKELYLTAEIRIDDSRVLNSLAHLKTLTLAEDEILTLKEAIKNHQIAREEAELALEHQKLQTQKERAQLRLMRSRLTLLERLNHQQLAEEQRLERLANQSEKLRTSVDKRINQQQNRLLADITFYKRSWAHGMTIKDARQYHRFVHKPFYSETDKTTLSFTDNQYQERFSEDRHDTYIIQQAYLNEKMTYLLAVTHKGHGRIKNIYIATEHFRNRHDQIQVSSVPLMQSPLGQSGNVGRLNRY